MSDETIIKLIENLPGIITAIASMLAAAGSLIIIIRVGKTKEDIISLRDHVNSKMDKLMASKQAEADAKERTAGLEGEKRGRADAKANRRPQG